MSQVYISGNIWSTYNKLSFKFVSVRWRPCLSMIKEYIIVVYPLNLKAWSWILAWLLVKSPTKCTTLTWNSDYFGSIGLESAYLIRNRQHSVGDVRVMQEFKHKLREWVGKDGRHLLTISSKIDFVYLKYTLTYVDLIFAEIL